MALDRLKLDVCYWIPCLPWQKDSRELARPEQRLAMLELALKGEVSMQIDTCELDRERPSYSIETIREFKKRFPNDELFFLLGSDQWQNFDSWRDWQAILKSVHPVIFTRAGAPLNTSEAVNTFVQDESISLQVIRCALPKLSSTQIRKMISQDTQLFDKLAPTVLPGAVLEYIEQNKLYRHSNIEGNSNELIGH